MKKAAYKSLVRPHCNVGLNGELENVQQHVVRFVTRNYSYETVSMTGILEELKWETPKKRRKDNRLILLCKGIKGKARFPTVDHIPNNRRCGNQHSMAFQISLLLKTPIRKASFPKLSGNPL